MRGRRNLLRASVLILLAALLPAAWSLRAAQAGSAKQAPGISKAAAKRCKTKLDSVEKYGEKHAAPGSRTTRFTEEEVNSYLALDLRSQFNPCLKTLQMRFAEGSLRGVALLDLDNLRTSSKTVMPRLLSLFLSGTHTLDARGRLISGNGQANFQLEEAGFDDTALPNSLVEQIITAVGKRQKPPFDPLQPSKLPYGIERVEIHDGYVTVFQ